MTMSSGELVSVIVPVYKVEEYLRQCVDSIINQTYKNLEIILVDDGSPDKCGEICEDYARNDSRVNVYHNENGGLSDARNYGMARSHGEYIIFVDSDDLIEKTFTETLLGLLKEYDADIAACPSHASSDDYELCNFKPDSEEKIYTGCFDADSALKKMLYQEGIIDTGACAKIYRRKVIEGIEYPKGIFVEDLATTYRIMLRARKVAFTSEKLYGYRLRHDSQFHVSYSPKMMACVQVSQWLYSEICGKRPALRLAAASRAFSVNRSHYFLLPNDKKEERMQVWEEMKKYRREVLSDPHARKRERIAALMTYLGPGFFHMFSKLYRRYLMMERN